MCTERTLNTRLQKLDALKTERAEIDEKIKALEDAIKEDLGDEEERKTSKYVVRWTRFTSSRFDSKAFGKIHPKLLQEFTKTSECRRFSYSAI